MKIVLVHNYYSSKIPSGENKVFEEEKELLKKNNHEVIEYKRSNDEVKKSGIIGKIKALCALIWNPFSFFKIKKIIKNEDPDVVHVHNTFPLISPSIFYGMGNRSARVITLHNYRLVCAAGIPMRNGNVCTECIDKKSVFPAMKYACYKNSRIATFPLVMSISLHKIIKTWVKKVDAIICLSEFQKTVMKEYGFPEEKLYVKPNFYPGNPTVVEYNERQDYVVFVGRLSHEKGVDLLIQAWRLWGEKAPELRLIGSGELESELKSSAKGLPIKFYGQLGEVEAQAHIRNARLLVLPSRWFEGFPMVIREAYAFGTPVVASDVGPLPSIVKNNVCGLTFSSNNAMDLLDKIITIMNNREFSKIMSNNSYKEFKELYTESINYECLIDIYNKSIRS